MAVKSGSSQHSGQPTQSPSSRAGSRHGRGRGGRLRIIAGQWRGRKLPVAEQPGLRPTSDRVRETVFNWLAMAVPGARVLDCFTGTGALSLEALSRGATSAVMLEKSPMAIKVLNDNLSLLKASNAQTVQIDSLEWLKRPAREPFNLVFLDPPFRMDLLEPTCQLLEENAYLTEDSLIYIETEKALSPSLPDRWLPLKSKTAGQVCFSLWSPNAQN